MTNTHLRTSPIHNLVHEFRPQLPATTRNLTGIVHEEQQCQALHGGPGCEVSRDAAKEKVDQLDARQKKESPVFMGIPSFSQVSVRTSFATNAP